MAISVHQLDDGAWISVDDARRVSVGELRRLARHDFCGCALADVLVEGFVEVGVDPPDIEARVAGQCIACGESGVTDWLAVGRWLDGEFYPVAPESVHLLRRSDGSPTG
ncbi:hypothetical protein BRC90_07245 [Halobacteriales archaeon QS_4_69_34]|nr:MAG: hypothetical protein BRC90_07245 [Halobacteriales archaeon QS_4_69_34]